MEERVLLFVVLRACITMYYYTYTLGILCYKKKLSLLLCVCEADLLLFVSAGYIPCVLLLLMPIICSNPERRMVKNGEH